MKAGARPSGDGSEPKPENILYFGPTFICIGHWGFRGLLLISKPRFPPQTISVGKFCKKFKNMDAFFSSMNKTYL